MLPLDDATATKIGAWGGSIILALAGAWKVFRHLRRDLRAESAEDASETAHERTIASLTRQADRQESVIANLSARLLTMDERLNVEIEARREAVHKSLDAAQHALALQHRLDAAETKAERLGARVAELETEIRELRLYRPIAGDMP